MPRSAQGNPKRPQRPNDVMLGTVKFARLEQYKTLRTHPFTAFLVQEQYIATVNSFVLPGQAKGLLVVCHVRLCLSIDGGTSKEHSYD
ncbi:MAG TPA: hypothetical protein VEL31_28440 [Ktedonobacteraceae bacterium]|nr:hypothetical protein [Ktedonobacteraceae bacterium]